jgi:hypothetical protein
MLRKASLITVSLGLIAALALVGLDSIGCGPNLGISYGYYGRLNRILARIQGNPEIEVLRTTLHHDLSLEDFYISVRMPNDREVRLRFENADTKPFSELAEELKRIGL